MNLEDKLKKGLAERKVNHLYRTRKTLGSPQSVEPVVNNKKVLSFCSNDYLGLANHAEVIASFKKAADEYGVGSGSAHLVSGHSKEHHALEEELADFMGYERALLFSTGYMANLGVISALCDRHSEIYEDKLNHASLLDAALLSRAKRIRYIHNDMESLSHHLATSTTETKLVVSDGVFSMDGDFAEVDNMAKLCEKHKSILMIDDAHGIGVVGEKGVGTKEYFNLSNSQIPLLVGTLGKAFGTAGAFVAGSDALIETLIQKSRSYIFTTAMPAAIAAATRKSLELIQKENWRREKLQHLIKRFRLGAKELGFKLMDSSTAIQPLIIGSSEKTLSLSEQLFNNNILISAIRPPTVPTGTSRLRITFSATHTEEHIDKLLDILGRLK